MKKKIVSLVFACTIILMTAAKAAAQDMSVGGGYVPINGEVVATVISATLPTGMSFTIDTNADVPFVTVPADIVNNTAAKLDVGLISIKRDPDSKNLQFAPTVVAPDSVQDWKMLGVDDSRDKIALGIKAGNSEETIWSPPEDETSDVAAGTVKIGPKATESIQLDCRHGLAWRASNSLLEYIMTLRVALTEE